MWPVYIFVSYLFTAMTIALKNSYHSLKYTIVTHHYSKLEAQKQVLVSIMPEAALYASSNEEQTQLPYCHYFKTAKYSSECIANSYLQSTSLACTLALSSGKIEGHGGYMHQLNITGTIHVAALTATLQPSSCDCSTSCATWEKRSWQMHCPWGSSSNTTISQGYSLRRNKMSKDESIRLVVELWSCHCCSS